MDWLATLTEGFKSFLPFLLTLAVISALFSLSRYLLSVKFRAVFTEYRFFRHIFFLILFAVSVTVLVLTLPVDDTLRGRLLALLGLLASAVIALSSTTFVGNAMAGLMLRTVRNFQPGDFLRVGEHWGRISEFGFLHTEIQTEERDLTTMPNLFLVTHPVTVVRSSGTIISARISLGYNIPHPRIEDALKMGATEAGLQEPFVQIMDLGDFSVVYRVSGFLSEVKHLLSARSRLREKVLDALHAAGIEIVSPTFMNQRILEPNRRFIPQKVRDPDADATNKEPESIIFDKADQAESVEGIKQKIKELEKQLSELEKSKDKPSGEKRQILENRIEYLKGIHKNLSEKL